MPIHSMTSINSINCITDNFTRIPATADPHQQTFSIFFLI